mgnify:CR=1 FL=1
MNAQTRFPSPLCLIDAPRTGSFPRQEQHKVYWGKIRHGSPFARIDRLAWSLVSIVPETVLDSTDPVRLGGSSPHGAKVEPGLAAAHPFRIRRR